MTVEVTSNHRCVGCGYCCKTATCTFGLTLAGEILHKSIRRCAALVEHDGRYWCALVESGQVRHEDLAIGAGCCSSLNSFRRQMLNGKPPGDRTP